MCHRRLRVKRRVNSLGGRFDRARAGSIRINVRLMTATPETGKRLLFRNVRVFDGHSGDLLGGDVLIDGDRITAVSESPIGDEPGRETLVVDGGNRVLMPG